MDALKAMTAYVVSEMERHSLGSALAGHLLNAYSVERAESGVSDLRELLEGSPYWADSPRVRELFLEMDLDKKEPDDLAFVVFMAFAHYRNLLSWTRHAAGVCCGQLVQLPGYDEWKRLDDALVDRLREVFASSDFESYRTDLEELVRR
jgi:hypothetical protein